MRKTLVTVKEETIEDAVLAADLLRKLLYRAAVRDDHQRGGIGALRKKLCVGSDDDALAFF